MYMCTYIVTFFLRYKGRETKARREKKLGREGEERRAVCISEERER